MVESVELPLISSEKYVQIIFAGLPSLVPIKNVIYLSIYF